MCHLKALSSTSSLLLLLHLLHDPLILYNIKSPQKLIISGQVVCSDDCGWPGYIHHHTFLEMIIKT